MKVTLILPWKMVREYDSGIRLEKVHKPDWYYLGKNVHDCNWYYPGK